ncbi:hypothetical protein TNCV_2917921 [Trichonephila clavipes]|nr:hypothetical protein TNCV_2917921 [Trichonephila clavipes]
MNAKPDDPNLQSIHQEVGKSDVRTISESNCGRRSRTQGTLSLARKFWVEFKSFMLKQDQPVKVAIRGLPSNAEPEDIKFEIEAEGFKCDILNADKGAACNMSWLNSKHSLISCG